MYKPNHLPTLRQLQLIQALDQYKSVSKVAQALHISQPSVSIQLKKASDLIGMPIYQQRDNGIELTSAGQAIRKSADEVLQCLDNLQVQLDDLKGLKSGTLNLSVVSTAKYFLTLLLGPFCKQHPLVDINLNIGNRNDVIARLQDNKDDFYFFSHCPENIDIITAPLIDNELVVVAPVDHELQGQSHIPLQRLQDYPFIMREPGSGTRRSIELFCKQHNIRLKERMTIESNEAIKYAVYSGLGLAILSRHTLDYGNLVGIDKLEVSHFPIRSQWYLVSKKERNQSLLAQAFARFMQEEGFTILQDQQKGLQ